MFIVPKIPYLKSESKRGLLDQGTLSLERKKENVDQLQLETLSESYENKHIAQEER